MDEVGVPVDAAPDQGGGFSLAESRQEQEGEELVVEGVPDRVQEEALLFFRQGPVFGFCRDIVYRL